MTKIVIFLLVVLITIFALVKFLEDWAINTRKPLSSDQTYEFIGSQMNYRVYGEGPPVVLVHGAMIARPWHGFDQELAKEYKVYMPDLPGFGASEGIDGAVHNTDLFASALCEFIDQQQLKNAPIIGLSMGAQVATKAADKGCADGKLVLIGAAGRVSGTKAKILQSVPRPIKRIIVSTYWGKNTLLIPVLNSNIGSKDEDDNSDFIADLETTDPRSIVDINYFKEQNEEFPSVLSRIENEKVFLYGENDAQKGSLEYDYVVIGGVGHNIFAFDSDQVLELVKAQLGGSE